MLADHESFETDFIGASGQDCRAWALEKQFQINMIEQDIIAVADKRSASDDTLSIQYYNRGKGLEFGNLGILPQEEDKWYDFRIVYKDSFQVYSSLLFVTFDASYPVYFGHKNELTDEHGIFDVAKATELCTGGVDW